MRTTALVAIFLLILLVSFEKANSSAQVQNQHLNQSKKLGLNIALFKKLGIKSGDKIVSVNKYKVRDSKEAFSLLNQHRPEDRVTVVVLREGQRVRLSTF